MIKNEPRGRRSRPFALPAVAAGALLVPLAAAPAAYASTDLCGQTITESLSLDRNLRCAGDGIRVAADVVLDLGGHTVKGTGTGAGITVDDTVGSARIVNGTVRGFDTNVVLEGTTTSTALTTLVLRDARASISFGGGALKIRRSTVSGPLVTRMPAYRSVYDVSDSSLTDVTFSLQDMPAPRFVDNDFVRGGIAGFENDGILIAGNSFTGAATAVNLVLSNGNRITGNRFSDNDVGLNVRSSLDRGNLIADNVFSHNAGPGAVIGDRYGTLNGTTVTRNAFLNNGAAGLWVNSMFPGPSGLPAMITRNRFAGNGFAPGDWVDDAGAVLNEGAHITASNGAPVTVSGNTAVGNAGIGLSTSAVTDGGGNRGVHNLGPLQCVGVAC